MEKYHDYVSKDYFRSTNHTGISALKQLFLKKKVEYATYKHQGVQG